MKKLSACTNCARQYDVSTLPSGSRFHCACGTVIAVSDAKLHESAVVRCSSCGAPRQAGSADCGFCSSDFTLHERDLNSMCPGCFTRISDRAQYCHSCGGPIAPQTETSTLTEHPCLVCGPQQMLSSRRLGDEDLSVLECGHCAGLWVDTKVFARIEEKARAGAAAGLEAILSTEAPEPGKAQPGPFYRRCLACDKIMNRQNFGRRSKVIVDVCKEHGIWLDDRELAAILRWIRDGGYLEAHELAAERHKHNKKMAGLTPAALDPAVSDQSPRDSTLGPVISLVLGGLFDF